MYIAISNSIGASSRAGGSGYPVVAIVDNFAQRVAADGGIMEAFGCVVEAILDLPQ